MENYKEPGWIEVITGPMFAGKSEELIRRVHRLDYGHRSYMVFKAAIDTRYSMVDVESHSHYKMKCQPVKKAEDILEYLKDKKVEVVAIDEVQFLNYEIVGICDQLANAGIRVIVAGLDTDFRGEPFPVTAALLAKAEFVTKLTAICVKCGAPATMSQRLVDGKPASYDAPIIQVGAAESYEPRCRHCHECKKSK
jgi:thymidine kinase